MAAVNLGALAKVVGGDATVLRVTVNTVSITGTGTVATGLTNIQAAFADVVNAGSTTVGTLTNVAQIGSISGGNVVPVVYNLATSTISIASAAASVQVVAIGQ